MKTGDDAPISVLIRPFQEFAARETSGGIPLLLCTVAALVWVNSPWAASYEALWNTKLTREWRTLSSTTIFTSGLTTVSGTEDDDMWSRSQGWKSGSRIASKPFYGRMDAAVMDVMDVMDAGR